MNFLGSRFSASYLTFKLKLDFTYTQSNFKSLRSIQKDFFQSRMQSYLQARILQERGKAIDKV